MQIHSVNINELLIPEGRQRREFKPEAIVELANSIAQNGLLQPIIIRRNDSGKLLLVAGERRIKAIVYVWNFGQTVRCGEEIFPEGELPCLYLGELDPLQAFEIELEENIRRVDLTWQERAQATSRLYQLRCELAEQRGEKPPTYADIAAEAKGDAVNNYQSTREEILVARHLDDPDVAKAKTSNEALKILKRKEERRKMEELGRTVSNTYTHEVHQLIPGDAIEELAKLPEGSVDVILTDPPYGIDAHEFGDSGGKTPGAHFYDDSFDTWSALMKRFSKLAFTVAKPRSHAYVFCDIDNFLFLRGYMSEAGWRCFRTPIIWVNPTAMRTPWVDMGPQRKYQLCLYAVKGDRPVTRIYSDVVAYPSDENLGHQAQKPVALYEDLLRRSAHPGDTILDPFCGSGPIFPAAHAFKCIGIGIEQDAGALGIAKSRIESLA